MEDQQNKPAEPTTGAPVMDVQPPQPAPVEPPAEQTPETSPEAQATSPAENSQPAPDSAPTNTDQPPHADNPLAAPTTPAQHHKGPIGAVVAAIIIGVLLIILAVFAYMKVHKSPTTAKSTTPPKTTASTTKPASTAANTAKVTGTDVSQTSQQLDNSLNSINDSKDFSSNDLSDSTLGL